VLLLLFVEPPELDAPAVNVVPPELEAPPLLKVPPVLVEPPVLEVPPLLVEPPAFDVPPLSELLDADEPPNDVPPAVGVALVVPLPPRVGGSSTDSLLQLALTADAATNIQSSAVLYARTVRLNVIE
jgi:hypothetical protein